MMYQTKTLRGLRLAFLVVVVVCMGSYSWALGFQTDTNFVAIDTLSGQAEVVTVEEPVSISKEIIQERLPKIQKSIPLNFNQYVHTYVNILAFKKAKYTQRMLELRDVYFPMYEKMLAEYELPTELSYLSVVESALNPRAVSHAGAVGLWQFMPGTGRDLRLKQTDYIDERMDPYKATEAACKHIRDLYNIFGDWELVMAAYNSGTGTVRRAMRRSGGETFWEIYNYLPKETRGYVPLYVATAYVLNYANDHGIYAQTPEYAIPFDTIHVNSYFTLSAFCRQCAIPLADFQKLNPHVITDVLPEETRNVVLRVPSDRYSFFQANREVIMDSMSRSLTAMPNVLLASTENINYGLTTARKRDWFPFTDVNEGQTDQPVVVANAVAGEDGEEEIVIRRKTTKIYYTVRRGEVLGRIAEKFDVGLSELKHWNHLRSGRIQRGQKLVVIREIAVTTAVRSKSARSEKEESRYTKNYKMKYHRVQQGDTLWNISMRYGGISVDRLKKLNKIRSNSLKLGQRLIVG